MVGNIYSIVVMGVSGSGKTTLGRAIATHLDCAFIEGDDYHPAANVALMRAGTPLTDKDRKPWLELLAETLAGREAAGQSTVLACSALKRAYRDQLRSAAGKLVVVCLNPDADELRTRLKQRSGHFMPARLLDSQLATLELPIAEPESHVVSVAETQDLDALCTRILHSYQQL